MNNNINKTLSSPADAGSVASSDETSETPSVDETSATPISRASKNWNRIKEISEKEDKRPPWRAVSVSTFPKPDKNALLRAKLLDASRRMRAGKIPVATQTEGIPTKIMKEANIDIQTDLIEMVDREILTDGTITIRQDGPGEFILTHSVAQMTDGIISSEAQTQTATPRITNRFFEEYYRKQSEISTDGNLDENLTKCEKKLIQQIREIRQIDEQLKACRSDNSFLEDNNFDRKSADSSELSDDSLLASGPKKSEMYTTRPKIFRKKIYKKPSMLKPTLPSWNFDFSDEDECSLPALPRRPYNDGSHQWSNLKDMVIGKKLANMKLSPIPLRGPSLKKKSVTWSDAQHAAVSELLCEANALLDVFDHMSIILGPDLKLNELPPSTDDIKLTVLSEHYQPLLQKSSEIIERKLNALKNPKFDTPQPISLEMFE